jgi:hypothetical protein
MRPEKLSTRMMMPPIGKKMAKARHARTPCAMSMVFSCEPDRVPSWLKPSEVPPLPLLASPLSSQSSSLVWRLLLSLHGPLVGRLPPLHGTSLPQLPQPPRPPDVDAEPAPVVVADEPEPLDLGVHALPLPELPLLLNSGFTLLPPLADEKSKLTWPC